MTARKILYIDLDDTLVDAATAFAAVDAETLAAHGGRADQVPGIYAGMAPKPGAVEAFEALAAVYDTYLLSTAPWRNPSAWTDKLDWVQHHFGDAEGTPAYKRLILSHHKNLNRGDYLVDDQPDHGAAEFTGEWLRFGVAPYASWADVTGYLLGRERG